MRFNGARDGLSPNKITVVGDELRWTDNYGNEHRVPSISDIEKHSPSSDVSEDKAARQMATIPTTILEDGQFISFRIFVPSGKTLNIWSLGVQNDSNQTPSGLTAEIDDETNSSNLVSFNSKRESGNPLESEGGDFDAAFRVENDTGDVQNASATFSYTLE